MCETLEGDSVTQKLCRQDMGLLSPKSILMKAGQEELYEANNKRCLKQWVATQ